MLSKDKLKKKGTGTYEEGKEQGRLVGDRTHEAYPVEQCNENARRAAGKRLANLRGDQRGEEKKRMHLIGVTEDDLHSAAQSKKNDAEVGDGSDATDEGRGDVASGVRSSEAGHNPTTRTKEAQNNGQTRTMQEAAHQKVAQAKVGDTNTAKSRRHTSSAQKTQNN